MSLSWEAYYILTCFLEERANPPKGSPVQTRTALRHML